MPTPKQKLAVKAWNSGTIGRAKFAKTAPPRNSWWTVGSGNTPEARIAFQDAAKRRQAERQGSSDSFAQSPARPF